MRNRKILCVVICVFLIITSLSGCSSKNSNMRDDFVEYHSDIFDKNVFTTVSNTKMAVMSLEKENTNSKPHIVLWITIGASNNLDEATNKWLQLSYDERKAELKHCGDMVVDYAKKQNWKNDYYLYVSVVNIYGGCDIVYDYELDTLYVPNCEDVFLQMYDKFGTFSEYNLADTETGKAFLIDNGLARLKHNEIEYTNLYGYTVFISNGEFKSFGDDDSKRY